MQPHSTAMHCHSLHPFPACPQVWWKESEEKARTIERTRKSSFIRAKEIARKTPNISEKILEQLPSEQKAEISRRLSQRGRRKPSRYDSGTNTLK